MSRFTTPKGKDIDIFVCPNTAHYKIKFVQGGELPECLSGMFTSAKLADQAIFQYLEESKQPRKKD